MTVSEATKGLKVVVIGAGQAGFSVCSKLRSLGFQGKITLVGDEKHPPYQRPPLSKAYLLGDMALERLFFRPQTFYAEKKIDLILSRAATSIDRSSSTVNLSDGTQTTYDRLVLATGSSPVTLPPKIAGKLGGIHNMRTLADADGMQAAIRPGRAALVVGGGYIGLEAAAVAAKSGMNVTLVEASGRILQRVASPETSDYFRSLHLGNGVDSREGVMLQELAGDRGHVVSAILSDGSRVAADCVIVGIGIRSNDEMASAAGLEIENGIRVDEQCRTSDPDIFAIGDCASFPYRTGRVRLESVGNAIDQGEIAARVIMRDDAIYLAKP